MKKLFIFVISLFMLSACVSADPYAIDIKASSNAPWQIGEITAKGGGYLFNGHNSRYAPIYRKFLGVTQKGAYYLVQDFYSEEIHKDKPFTSPFLLIEAKHVSQPIMPLSVDSMPPLFYPIDSRSGPYTTWYPNGNKASQMYYWAGMPKGEIVFWYENGNKQYQSVAPTEKSKGFYLYWDEEGNLIESGSPY